MKNGRIVALDGLKGLAILMVIFGHLPVVAWWAAAPGLMQPVLAILLGSGGIGVSLFFITTGFLMGKLYPSITSPLVFYKKRYARLFPPFLVMVVTLTTLQLFKLPVLGQVAVFLIAVLVIRKIAIPPKLIIGLQLVTAAAYLVLQWRVPSAVFYIVWPKWLQVLTSGVVNANLLVPLGKYVGPLDGVYWALSAELFFICYTQLSICR